MIDIAHGTETIGYLAIEPGTETWNSLAYEAQTTGAQFTEIFSPISFCQSYSTSPCFVGSLSNFGSSNNAHLCYHNLSTVSIDLKIEEDTTRAPEIFHEEQSVSYLVIGGQGILTSIRTSIGDDQTKSFIVSVTETGSVKDLNVTLNVRHPHLEDVDVFLETPDGTTVKLFTDVGGIGEILTGTMLDDEATQSIDSGSAPYSGRFQLEGLLCAFRGKTVMGTWTLHVTNNTANGEAGAIVGASLDIEPASALIGNLNHDSRLDADDIDLLFANLGSTEPTFDLDHEGDADKVNVDELVLNIMGKRYGDVDLDYDVDITDFNRLISNLGPLGSNEVARWGHGNFDGEGNVDIRDFNQIVLNFTRVGHPAFPVGNLLFSSAAEFDSAGTVVQQASRANSASTPGDSFVSTQPSTEPARPLANELSEGDVSHGAHGKIA